MQVPPYPLLGVKYNRSLHLPGLTSKRSAKISVQREEVRKNGPEVVMCGGYLIQTEWPEMGGPSRRWHLSEGLKSCDYVRGEHFKAGRVNAQRVQGCGGAGEGCCSTHGWEQVWLAHRLLHMLRGDLPGPWCQKVTELTHTHLVEGWEVLPSLNQLCLN